MNLLSSLPDVQYGSYGNYTGSAGDIQGYKYLPLSAVVHSSITSALQIQWVNSVVVLNFISANLCSM